MKLFSSNFVFPFDKNSKMKKLKWVKLTAVT